MYTQILAILLCPWILETLFLKMDDQELQALQLYLFAC